VKPVALVPVPMVLVTDTVTLPAVPAGLTALMVVELVTVYDVAAVAPNFTAVAPVRPVPVMVTVVPPAAGPLVGLIDETVGTGTL
jgi:hypothetical protein